MRVFARRERPHCGAQLTLFEAADGWRYSLWRYRILQAAARPGDQEELRGLWNPRPPGPPSYPNPKIKIHYAAQRPFQASDRST
jgi:hypothetical protein